MNVESVIPILVGVALALDGVWMMTGARFLLPIPRWNYPGNTAGLRVIGAGATIGGVGIAAGSGILAAYGPLSAGFYVVAVGVLGMTLCYGAAWWVNHRARRPVSSLTHDTSAYVPHGPRPPRVAWLLT